MSHHRKQELPDLDDMLLVGMSLTEALAFWNGMMSASDRKASDWWQRVNSWRTASQLLQ
jgi:hypothetical protein